MKRLINRIVLTATALFAVAGTMKAQLDLQNNLTGATVNWYISSSVPTADNPGTAATPGTTKINVGEYVVVKVTPTSGHWTYDGAITFQVAGGIGGGEAPRRALKLPVNPTALSSNWADGTGYYYYKIPEDCTPGNGYKKVIFDGEVFEKINLNGASIDGTGKIVTATTGGWTATITLDEIGWTYDASAHLPSISSFTLSNGTKTFTNTAQQVSISGTQTNVGNYNASLAAVDNGCLKNSKNVPFRINKKTLTITANNHTITYGDAPANNGVTYSGFEGTEDESVLGGTLAYDYTYTQYGNVGDYSITPKGLTSTNYDITFTPGKLTVSQKEIGLSWSPSPSTFTYDGTPKSPTATATGLVNSDEVSVTVMVAGEHTAVGNYTATASGLTGTKAGNYKLPAVTTQAFSIGKKTLTITANNHTIIYGDAPANNGVTYSGFEGTEDESVLGGTLAYDYTYSQYGNVGDYSITPKGLTSTNYDITFTSGKLTVSQKVVGLNWTNTLLTFNGSEQVPTAEAIGIVNNDEIGVNVTGAKTDVGNGYIATASMLTGTKSGNYKLPDDNTHEFSIAEAGMSGISVFGYNNQYDGTAHGINVIAPVGATVKYGESVGTYELTSSPQYTNVCDKTVYYKIEKAGFTAVTGSAKVIITKADLTVTAKDKTITYGDVPTNDGVTYSGFVGTDDASVLDGTLGYDYNYTQYGNVGDNYSITPKNLTSTNYNITFTVGKLTVNQKEVGLTWPNTHLTFNGTEQVPTCEATGLVNGDEVGVTVIVAGEHTAIGNYTATASALTGAKAGNYKLPADNTHTFSIDEAGMAGIVATGFNNTYDGTAHGINVTIPDGATVKFGETEGTYDLNTSPEYTDVCNKIVYYKVTKAGFSDVTGSAKVIITQKEVGLNWTNTSLVFDGTPQEPHCTAVELVNGDEVGVTVTVAGEHTAVGNYTATASALTGAKAGNYKLPDANTQAFSISAVLTTIRVVRNDTGEDVPNVVATTESIDGEGHEIWTIDRVNITAPADASANKLVSVSVYIPATIKAGADDKVLYGVGSDILVTSAYVPVTDIYMPETDEIIDVQANAFRLNATASVTARIHTPLALLDDYALNAGLKDEYEDGHVMSTISPTTHYWTLSSGVDVVVPNGVTAYTCQADGTSAVAAIAITNTTAMVEETERVIIKANNGVLMGNQSGTGGTYDLVAWPSADRPSGTAPTTIDAKTYDGNLMEPALVRTHFAPNDYYILYNNTFHELKPTDDTFVSPCKAVLRKNSSVMASKLRINVGSDTGINELVNNEESVDDWYTLDGVKLNSKPTQKGVYINGGKKVFMK